MLSSEVVVVGGIGYVVPEGGPEITGVLVLVLLRSLPLQEANNKQQSRRRLLSVLCVPLRPSASTALFNGEIAEVRRENISDLLVDIMLDCRRFSLFVGEWLTGDAILAFNPPAQVN